MRKLCASVIDAIGGTPLVELGRLVRECGVEGRMLAKLEYLNPGFSKKDRVALHMILEAEREGELHPGQTVVELTSGNTGTGLAIVCGARGYPFVAVMSKGNSPERARMMHALGAEVVLVEQSSGAVCGEMSDRDLDLVEETVRRLVKERGAFWPNQFVHRGNVLGEEILGEELWEQSGGVDVYLDMPGSAGSFTGCSRSLKRHSPSARCYLLEPENAGFFSDGPSGNGRHRIQGCGYRRELPHLDRALVDGFLRISDDDAVWCARLLARTEGIFAGFSTGAHVAAALRLLAGPERGRTVAFLAVDSGLKYLSTDLY